MMMLQSTAALIRFSTLQPWAMKSTIAASRMIVSLSVPPTPGMDCPFIESSVMLVLLQGLLLEIKNKMLLVRYQKVSCDH